jgi:hypothetical protein
MTFKNIRKTHSNSIFRKDRRDIANMDKLYTSVLLQCTCLIVCLCSIIVNCATSYKTGHVNWEPAKSCYGLVNMNNGR